MVDQDRCLVVPRRRVDSVAPDEYEAGLIFGMILNVFGENLEPPDLSGTSRGDHCGGAHIGLGNFAGGVSGGTGGGDDNPGKLLGKIPTTLGESDWVRANLGDLAERDAR